MMTALLQMLFPFLIAAFSGPVVAASDSLEYAEKMSDYYEEQFVFSKAAEWREKALQECRKRDTVSYEYADNLYRLSKLYYRSKEYYKTFEYANEAIDLFASLSCEKRRLECLNVLGSVYYVCKDFDKSNGYFEEFAKGAEKLGDSSLLVLALNNMAVYTNTSNDPGNTRRLISKCMDISRKMKDTAMVCRLYINMAASYVNTSDLDTARQCLQMAYPLMENIEQKGQYYHYLGVIEHIDGNDDEAVDALLKASGYYGKGEFEERQQFCLELLQDIYAGRGEYDKAYGALHQYYVNYKSSRENDGFIKLFRVQNELADSKRKKEELYRERTLALSLAGGFSVLLLAATGLFVLYKKREFAVKRREQELVAMNEMAEMKRMQQYKTDMMVKETVSGLNRIAGNVSDDSLKNDLMGICSTLHNLKDKDEWKETCSFVPRFNSSFYRNLLKSFPDLTVNERRLCVFLNMNLTTKEISEITRQSVQSINTARGRLRNKLGITGDSISIQEFLSRFNDEDV